MPVWQWAARRGRNLLAAKAAPGHLESMCDMWAATPGASMFFV